MLMQVRWNWKDRFRSRQRRFHSWTRLCGKIFPCRARINLLLALVLTLGSGQILLRLVARGLRVQGRRSKRHTAGSEFIDTIVAGLNEAPDAEVRLNQNVHDLNRLATSVFHPAG